MTERNQATTTTGNELVIERVFEAPCEMVFRAWTDPEHFVQWWGPDGFSTPYCTLDVRVGGKLHFCMRSSEYGDIWCGGEFKEIDPPSKLVYTDFFADEQGNKVAPTQYGMSADFPEEALVTVTFEDLGSDKTKMTLRHGIPATLVEQTGASVGWSQSFDRLAAYLAQAT